MKGYSLFQKGKYKAIKIALKNDQDSFVDVLVFATKKGLMDSLDVEHDDEIRRVEVLNE